MWYCVIILWHR